MDHDDLHRWMDEHGHIDKQMLHLRGLISDAHMFGPDEQGEALGGSPLRRAKGFRITVVLDDRHCTVGVFWGGELGEQVAIRGWPDQREHVLGVLRAHQGEPVPVGGGGETVTLHLDHPLVIRAALAAYGEVESVAGDDPPGWPG